MAAPSPDPVLIRAIVTDFYERVFKDVMIGFLFRNSDKARLIEKEVELALGMLGAAVPYTGKSLASAHARFDIRKGMFDRRLQILRDAMAAHELDPALREAWLKHSESLRSVIVRSQKGECRD